MPKVLAAFAFLLIFFLDVNVSGSQRKIPSIARPVFFYATWNRWIMHFECPSFSPVSQIGENILLEMMPLKGVIPFIDAETVWASQKKLDEMSWKSRPNRNNTYMNRFFLSTSISHFWVGTRILTVSTSDSLLKTPHASMLYSHPPRKNRVKKWIENNVAHIFSQLYRQYCLSYDWKTKILRQFPFQLHVKKPASATFRNFSFIKA